MTHSDSNIYLLTEDDGYEPCAGEVFRNCFVTGPTRLEHRADENFLISIKRHYKCIEREAETCGAAILKHFIAYMKMHEKYFEEGQGEYGKMVEEGFKDVVSKSKLKS